MNRIDIYLVLAAIGLYLLECIHFLRPSDIAYTGFLKGRAKEWRFGPLSYTLLGFHLCVVNPLITGTGFARLPENFIRDPRELQLDLADTKKRIRLFLLETLTSVLAALMLIALPAIVYLGRLSSLWIRLTIEVLLVHSFICVLFALELKRWLPASAARTSKIIAVCLNPLASIRCIDVLSNAIVANKRQPR